MQADPGYYDFQLYGHRPKIVWPKGAKLAFWVAPNIEFYELYPPTNPQRRPWPRPLPDIVPYSHRDYGNRVGLWRMMEAMDDCQVRGSISLSVAICDHHPEIIEACKARRWEFFSHGIYNTRYSYGMNEAQENAVIEDAIQTVYKATGERLVGWLAPALTHTERTMELIAAQGIRYTCDLFQDDRPQLLNIRSGTLISMPYSLEINDVICYNTYGQTPRQYGDLIKRQFDRLYMEGEASGTVMCIPLHPFLVGQPHRIAAFHKALAYCVNHKDGLGGHRSRNFGLLH